MLNVLSYLLCDYITYKGIKYISHIIIICIFCLITIELSIMKPTYYEFEKKSDKHICINTFSLKVVGDGQTGRTGIVVQVVPVVIENGDDSSLGYLTQYETRQLNKLKMRARREDMRTHKNKEHVHSDCPPKLKVPYGTRRSVKQYVIQQPRPGF